MRTILYPFIRRNPYYMRGGSLSKNPPDYSDVRQWLGKTYKSDDGVHYIEDKTIYGNNAIIGDNPTLVGDGSTVSIPSNIVLTNKTRVEICAKFNTLISNSKLFGARKSSSSGLFFLGCNTNGNWYYIAKNDVSGLHEGTSADTDIHTHTIDAKKKIYSRDGTIMSSLNVDEFTTLSPASILSDNIAGSTTGYSDATLFYCKIYEDDVLVFDTTAQEGNGSYTFNTVTKKKLFFIGSQTNIHGTSNFQTPYAHLNGCDMWYRLSDNKWKNTPLQDDGTSCQGENDTDDDGYVWQYKVDGIGLNDKEGLNGTEILYQPEESTTLPTIENDNFTTRIWYDALGNALPIDVKNLTYNYENKGISYNDTSKFPYISNQIVYATPQIGQDDIDSLLYVNGLVKVATAEDGIVYTKKD